MFTLVRLPSESAADSRHRLPMVRKSAGEVTQKVRLDSARVKEAFLLPALEALR